MDRKAFDESIMKRCGKKRFKINNSWGTYDIFKYLRQNKWPGIGKPVSQKLFHHITRRCNELMAEEVKRGHDIKFPMQMGELGVKRMEVRFTTVNGRIVPVCPIDWKSTMDLWYSDPEAKEKKIILRYSTTKDYYRVRYLRTKANYPNKNFYEFAVNRYIKLGLRDTIINDEIETTW